MAPEKAGQAALTITSTSGTFGSTLTLSTGMTGSGVGAVTYAVTTPGTAGCTVLGSSLSAISAGTCTVTATKAGDTNYNQVSSSATLITFAKPPQATLTLTSNKESVQWRASNVRLTVSDGSGTGALSYTVSAGCTVDWQNYYPVKLTSDMARVCTVTVTKAADDNYASATSAAVSVTFTQISEPHRVSCRLLVCTVFCVGRFLDSHHCQLLES